MRYDLHVHINIHGDEGEMERYEYYAKINNLDTVGFVIHYNPKMSRRELRDYRDFVYSLNLNALAGLELYYPIEKVPSGFDFHIVHFSRLTVDADTLAPLRDMIIAHPFAYEMHMDASAFGMLRRNNLAVECNSAHYSPRLRGFYEHLREEGVVVPFGSDAHTPDEMGSGFDELSDMFSPLDEVLRYLGLI